MIITVIFYFINFFSLCLLMSSAFSVAHTNSHFSYVNWKMYAGSSPLPFWFKGVTNAKLLPNERISNAISSFTTDLLYSVHDAMLNQQMAFIYFISNCSPSPPPCENMWKWHFLLSNLLTFVAIILMIMTLIQKSSDVEDRINFLFGICHVGHKFVISSTNFYYIRIIGAIWSLLLWKKGSCCRSILWRPF